MKSHNEIEIDTAIFSSTSGFAPGEITGFFFHKCPTGNEKGQFSLPKLPKNFRLGRVLATAEKMIGSEQIHLRRVF